MSASRFLDTNILVYAHRRETPEHAAALKVVRGGQFVDEEYLRMFRREAGDILRKWWSQGNQHEIDVFFEVNGLGSVQASDISDRWKRWIR